MTDTDNIGAWFERIVQAISHQPSLAQGTVKARASYTKGLACLTECGPWQFLSDMPKQAGGQETGPSPGNLMLMSLASCQVITTALWAAHLGIPIEKLEVEASCDKDSRGLYGVNDLPPRWKSIRLTSRLQSPAPEEQLRNLVKAALEHSPMRDNLENSFKIETVAEFQHSEMPSAQV